MTPDALTTLRDTLFAALGYQLLILGLIAAGAMLIAILGMRR